MDELELLNRALPDARPPAPEVVARARARVASGTHAPGRAGAGGRAGVRATRRWMRAWWAAPVTVTVVGLVFALVTNLAPPSAPVLTRPNQALYDLADRIERLPAEKGAYWRAVELWGSYVYAPGGYTFLSTFRQDRWLPRKPGGPKLLVSRPGYTMNPLTEADERAWRAAGSPDKITVQCGDGGFCGEVEIKRGHDYCSYTRTDTRGGVSENVFSRLTVAELAALPTGQDALMAWLRAFHKEWAGRDAKPAFEEFLPAASNLLAAPIGPAQRAALIRLLAASPLTKVVGEVRGPLGGRGLSLDFGELDHVFSEQLSRKPFPYQRRIIDVSTGEWLADVSYAGRAIGGEAKGAPLMFAARHVSTGWAEGPPVPPKGCKEMKTVGG
ncbi:hypothetical protein AB0M50_05360 [Nonomuraea fuscirosea]|uniref:hypothetical protein n=1 Tax=Nonomuraea fuscirosea TaxID=1291556 RepID=UPI003412F11B